MIGLDRPAEARNHLNACYGETLDVSLRTMVAPDAKVTRRKIFALPSPNAWLVNLSQGGLLDDQPCVAEPIEASRVWSGFIEPRLGHADLSIPGVQGVRFQWLRLSSPGTQAAEQSEERRVNRLLSEGAVVHDEFVRRKGENTDAVGGGWLFPESHLSPIGTRTTMSCTLDCLIAYRIERNLKLTYSFVVEDETEIPPWIEIDNFVRAFVLGMIKEN